MYHFEDIKTPSYIFDIDEFHSRIKKVDEALCSKIDLCYSIKANPFLTGSTPKEIKYLEVCSPGELTICEKVTSDLSRIIFSGVNKTENDVMRALDDNVGIFTAESLYHADLIDSLARKKGKKVKLILRLTAKNQFGMSEEDLISVIKNREKYDFLDIIGLHYYSGTQKKKVSVIQKELDMLGMLIDRLKDEFGYTVSHLEYGPGLACDYFSSGESENIDMELLSQCAPILLDFSKRYPLSIEMGRFFASSCGSYFTKVMDIKNDKDTDFVICDGGIHQIKYYGQTMAMQVPNITVQNPSGDEVKDYYLCGSLCTVADVLVRKASLRGLDRGSVLKFDRCGAYSACEGIALFLSRDLPCIYLYSDETGLRLIRDTVATDIYNTPLEINI